ncbi:uncharacterized protein BJ171DRAFT_600173 [Polychytrium aggregatum]|uniref:uncharacterized protein n=1 Tax=Polychytrium aggregatum TaxID=110093 RepID=UPI0022FE4EC6|nr:uncharacterized protein BJ171DRAFT_600173 [Polychytrium aggregatum]KAI9203310.1 hypothetical protein BJ171DRAFT_600173 [Polychytrium aggregatum]
MAATDSNTNATTVQVTIDASKPGSGSRFVVSSEGGVIQPLPSLNRLPRVGNNSKNTSNPVFRFGGSMDFPEDVRRYKVEVAAEAKIQRQDEREKRAVRYQQRRLEEIEKQRWQNMSIHNQRQEETWNFKHKRAQIGKNSVHYNPITLAYHNDSQGTKLATDDRESIYRTSLRAAHLYLKNNTFDPLLCKDIPRALSEPLKAPPQPSQPRTRRIGFNDDGERRSALKTESLGTSNVPQMLMRVAAQNGAVLGAPTTGLPMGGGSISDGMLSVDSDIGRKHQWRRHY